MSTPPFLPAIPGLGWSRRKSPTFATRVASHTSGREARSALYAHAIYEFEATYDALSSNAAWPGLGEKSLQSLMGFFLSMQGGFGTFLYVDPEDWQATGEIVATGDGAASSFLITRAMGLANEPVSYVTSLQTVYVNGAPLSQGWSLTLPNMLTFAAPPPAGAAISADFTFAYECRFSEDQMNFEEFMADLWALKSLKFKSVKA